jgi:two-component sensor histidine kinase
MAEALWAPGPLPAQRTADRTVGRWHPANAAELTANRLALSAAVHDRACPVGAAEEAVDRLLLAFEELASNALRHGRPPFEVMVTTVGEHAWLLRVSDAAGETPPTPAVGRDAALGGLGLHMVAALADDYGWTRTADGGKKVWARIDFGRADAQSDVSGPAARPGGAERGDGDQR